MVKREAEYNQDLGNWWFGRFNRFSLDDLTIADPYEQGYGGQSCFSCHITDDRAERTDWLIGVPRSSLAP